MTRGFTETRTVLQGPRPCIGQVSMTDMYQIPALHESLIQGLTRVLHNIAQDAETREIQPTEYLGVQLVSFGFAGQGSAIMRGPMASGVVNQLLTTALWWGSLPESETCRHSIKGVCFAHK